MKKFDSYTYGETTTAGGQLVRFTCENSSVESIKAMLENSVRTVEPILIHQTNITLGGYGYSRYEIVQHKYAGGQNEAGGGFIEVIEVKNPPNGRHPFILHEYNTHDGGKFSEWETIKDAIRTFETHWALNFREEGYKKQKGFRRVVKCGPLTPWFYAVGEEVLVGDYALTSGLEDDPVYRLGRKFVVYDSERVPHIKTCMGTRFWKNERRGDWSEPASTTRHRLVYFDDGTMVEVSDNGTVSDPSFRGGRDELRPIQDGEKWIVDAIEKFAELLSGKSSGFQLKFANGATFTANLAPKGKGVPSVEGDYLVKVHYDEWKIAQGWIRDFVPTAEVPDVVSLVKKSGTHPNIEKVEILKHKPRKGGKKWSGVFYLRPE